MPPWLSGTMDGETLTRTQRRSLVNDNESNWPRQVVIAITVIVVVGALVGSIVAVVAVKAADYLGVGDKAGSSSPGPVLPTTGAITRSPTNTAPSSSAPATSKPPPQQHVITLTASPRQAASYQRVNLTGSYPGHDGAVLQVQRRVGNGAWSDFPTSTHVSGGRFATYIQTGMAGVNRFRVVDKATGKASNVASVTIG